MTREDMWLWLCSRRGIYFQGIQALLYKYHDIEKIYHFFDIEDITMCMTPYYQNNKLSIFPKEQWGERYISILKEEMKKKKIGFISIESKYYPLSLKEIEKPPFGLFYKGNIHLLNYDYLAIAGTRHPSSYGKEMSDYFSSHLCLESIPIISGMAMGIDSYFHRRAIEMGIPTIGVLGQGVDICYPIKLLSLYKDMVEEGLLISEFPPGCKPLSFHFPFRNRIIVGMSQGLLVIEAGMTSGTSHTVGHALNQGRDVYVVPSSFLNESGKGNNQMIYEGAEILVSWEQLLENLKNKIINKEKRNKNSEYRNIKSNILENKEALVYSMLNKEPKYLEDIVKISQWDRVELRKTLMALERKGVCKEIYPHYFVKV